MQPLRAGIYGRQSRGRDKSINDQISECTADAQAQGWHIAGTWRDGSSASRYARKERDEWQRVCAAIDAREIDVLVLWESSRGDRALTSWSALLDTCRARGVAIRVHTHGRTYDLRNARDWRTLAEDGVDSAYESEKTASRVRRGQAAAAAAGRPSQGRCPYGYRRTYDPRTGALTGQEADPDTAPVVARIIRDVAVETPLVAITRRLLADGTPAPGAAGWSHQRVRDVAMNPAYIGKRTYGGQQYDGGWEPLIDTETFYTAQRVLSDPGRVTTKPGKVRHLLSYLAACGVCGERVTVAQGRYRCTGGTSCTTIVQGATDALVTEVIVRLISRPDYYTALRQAGDDQDQEVMVARKEVADLRARLDTWRASAAAGKTTPESLAVIEASLTAEIRAAQGRAERAAIPPALRAIISPGEDVRERWDAAPLPARRDVIRSVARVRIMPASAPGSRVFEAARVLVLPLGQITAI